MTSFTLNLFFSICRYCELIGYCVFLSILANIGTNPGLAALWEDEKQRRRNLGESSQITPPDSQGNYTPANEGIYPCPYVFLCVQIALWLNIFPVFEWF